MIQAAPLSAATNGTFKLANTSTTIPSETSVMGMGKSDFLKLLVAQLRNQDPMKPMEDTEFIAQMAQLNTLEQIANLNARLDDLLALEKISSATALVGRTVTAHAANGETISGKVEQVKIERGGPMLVVDNREISLSEVESVD